MIIGRRKDFGTGFHDGEYAVFIQGGGAGNPPTITDSNGQEHRGVYLNSENGQAQFVFPSFTDPGPATFTYGGQSQEIPGFGSEFQGGGVGSLQQRSNKGPSASGAGGGAGTGFGGSAISGGVAYPTDISGEFPDPVLTGYDPIKAAPYKYVDPIKFAEKFGQFNRTELGKNMQLAKEFAMDQIDTELDALTKFVPIASGIKRYETAADNIFNQQQRTQQLESTIPDQLNDLNSIRDAYTTYSQGEVPNAVVDNALTLGTASAAADVAATSGFGVNSSAARKLSDLMSAQDRIGLSQMGLEGLRTNVGDQANLRLAPTAYSDAGQQVNVMPSVSGSQLQVNAAGEINARTTLDPSTALSSQINQNQFGTQLEQTTRQFNASNTLQNDQFNATNQNTFGLELFNYKAQFANAVQQADQGGLNIAREDALREQNQEIFQDYFEQAQQAGNTQAIAAGISQIAQLFGGIGGFLGFIKDQFGEDIDTEDSETDFDIDGDGDTDDSVPDFSPDFDSDDRDSSSGGGGASGDDSLGVDPDGNPILPDVDAGIDIDGDGRNDNNEVPDFDSGIYADNPYDSASLNQFYADMA